MGDYDFLGLSSRSFEQLVQALAGSTFGPGVKVFGDGPDGGREATFEGRAQFPNALDPWDGYTVFQAKFRQRAGRPDDQEWFLSHVRAELAAYKTRSRRVPDYIIFATNVVMSSVSDSGGKDKYDALLRTFADEMELKGWFLWDNDQLRALLDSNDSIRRTYSPWVTAGDVFAKLLEQLASGDADFGRTLDTYIQKELLLEEFVNLEQAGHTSEEKIPIAKVFVDLPLTVEALDWTTWHFVEPHDSYGSEGGSPDHAVTSGATGDVASAERRFRGPATVQHRAQVVAELLQIAQQRLDADALYSNPDRAPMTNATANPSRIVIVGGPGQGKTTVGQFLCQVLRASILKRRPDSSLSAESKVALRLFTDRCVEDDMDLDRQRRFPIRIVFSEFADSLASTADGTSTVSLLQYIGKTIERRVGQPIDLQAMKEWLSSYPCLIVLDGLDEVPGSANRDEVLSAVKEFWIEVASDTADVMVVATTRPQGYNDDFSPAFYSHWQLAPLLPSEAVRYGKRFAEMRYGSDSDRERKVVERLVRAASEASTARLMESPLQVTIMATLVDRMGQPPQERWNLFNAYYNVIYERESERDIEAASILRRQRAHVDAIHHRVGLRLQVEAERNGKSDARLSLSAFTKLVDDYLSSEGYEKAEMEGLRDQIIDCAATRLVFLVGVEENAIGFEIRSLQEFMASEGIVGSASESLVLDRLRSLAPIALWRNVFLFIAGKYFADRHFLRDSLLVICEELDTDSADSIDRITARGAKLALDLAADGSARSQPKYQKLLITRAFGLVDTSFEDPTVICSVFEPSVEGTFDAELRNRIERGGATQKAGAWACVMALIDAGAEFASTIEQELWPKDRDAADALVGLGALPVTTSAGIQKAGQILPTTSWKSLVDGLVSLQRAYRHAVPEEGRFEELAASWTRTLLELLTSSRVPDGQAKVEAWLEGLLGPDMAIRYSRMGGIAEELAVLADIPDTTTGVEFELLRLVGQFCASPDPRGLAAVLERASRIEWETARSVLRHVTVPWPLNACLHFAQDQSDLLKLAQGARAGRLGSWHDWAEAEVRFQQQALTLADFEYTAGLNVPFDDRIAETGAALIYGGYLSPSAPVAANQLAELVNWIARLPPGYGRGQLAEMIAFNSMFNGRLFGVDVGSAEVPYTVGRVLLETSLEFPGTWLSSEMLRILSAPGGSDARADSAFLTGLAGRTGHVQTLDRRWTEAFGQVWLQDHHPELLMCLQAGNLDVLPAFFGDGDLDPRAQNAPELRAAAVVLAARCPSASPLRPEELGALWAEDMSFVYQGLTVLDAADPRAVTVVITCMDRLDGSDAVSRVRLMKFLESAAIRRASHVGEGELWAGLGLDQGTS